MPVAKASAVKQRKNLSWNMGYNENYNILKPDWLHTDSKPKTRIKFIVY